MNAEDLARLTEEERAIWDEDHRLGCQRPAIEATCILCRLLTRLALARRVVEAARTRLALEGHEPGCQFRGCTCGRYDEAKAARQDVQRELAAHDAGLAR